MPLTRLWPVAALLIAALAGCGGSGGAEPAPAATSAPAAPAASSPVPPIEAATTAAPTTRASSPRPTATFGGLQLAKTGGIAGVREVVSIDADGSWRRLDGATVAAEGKLSASERTALTRLVNDPALTAEAARKTTPGRCADAFNYLLTVNHLLVRYTQCGGGDKPEQMLKVIDYVGRVITR